MEPIMIAVLLLAIVICSSYTLYSQGAIQKDSDVNDKSCGKWGLSDQQELMLTLVIQ